MSKFEQRDATHCLSWIPVKLHTSSTSFCNLSFSSFTSETFTPCKLPTNDEISI
ncbi:hypothetical protein Mapa_014783 [Marchantia paleacea]|nr:hypothetical protein Mapa_014783 [Marchantia paleacea]